MPPTTQLAMIAVRWFGRGSEDPGVGVGAEPAEDPGYWTPKMSARPGWSKPDGVGSDMVAPPDGLHKAKD